tara:strand:+ start:932 stop:1144 length:213 start_codon:yes stop_codon:yes gene_type:complete
MSDLTADQVDALTHAWVALRAIVASPETSPSAPDVQDSLNESIDELEQAFPFLRDGVTLDEDEVLRRGYF